jgi:Protein of unknown function (DUF4065)
VFNRHKFKQLVHYVCYRRTDRPSTLGAVKLNKILWLCDFLAYRELEEPVTGARYVKRQFGPVPHHILPVLGELETERALTIRDVTFHGKTKKVFTVLKPISGDFLSQREKTLVDRVIDFVCDENTAASISEASHDDIWKMAEDGEEMPYFTIFANRGTITAEDREWARMQLEQAG